MLRHVTMQMQATSILQKLRKNLERKKQTNCTRSNPFHTYEPMQALDHHYCHQLLAVIILNFYKHNLQRLTLLTKNNPSSFIHNSLAIVSVQWCDFIQLGWIVIGSGSHSCQIKALIILPSIIPSSYGNLNVISMKLIWKK